MARGAMLGCKSSSKLKKLTSLTHLELDGCTVPDGLASLSALTGLERLGVSVMTHDPAGVSGVPFAALSRLTHLNLGVDVCDNTCRHLQQLTALKELHISKYAPLSAAGLEGLAALQQLTQLHVCGANYALSNTTTPGLSRLTALKHLEVTDSRELNPQVLQQMTGLQHLALVHVSITPVGMPLDLATSIRQLLALLPRMQQLTHLNLTGCLSWPQVSQAYSALTAAPKLACLIVRSGHFPEQVWQHLLPDGRIMPHLEKLMLQSTWTHNTALQPGGIVRLACSSPSIANLELDLSRQSPVQLLDLTKLSALTQLTTSSIGDPAMPSLAQLSRLRRLKIERPESLTVQGLLQLTVMRGLARLLVQSAATRLSRAVSCLSYNRHINLRSRPVSGGILECVLDHVGALRPATHDH